MACNNGALGVKFCGSGSTQVHNLSQSENIHSHDVYPVGAWLSQIDRTLDARLILVSMQLTRNPL